jgi:phosphatidate cytidylyltransferase
MALDLKTFKTRTLSAIVFAAVLIGSVCWNYYSFCFLFLTIAVWALIEFFRLAEKMGAIPFKTAGIVGGVFTFFSVSISDFNFFEYHLLNKISESLIFLVPFVTGIAFLFSKNEKPFLSLAFTLGGIFYVVLPFALLVKLPVHPQSFGIESVALSYDYFKVLGLILLIWANDTFAYIGGSLIGRNKIMERVSPGKTWEGTMVGLILTVVTGFALNYSHTYASALVWPCIAFLVGVFGTIGDLTESLMKRQAGVKDSGSIMPGHGGVLDRFDSLLFVSPLVYVVVKLAESTA